MKRLLLYLTFVAVLVLTAVPGRAQDALDDAERPVIEIALCLDTSSSMDALLETVRLELWDIVGRLAAETPPPRLRVALLTYGSSSNPVEKGWVRIETPLTENLDLVSARLFELTPGGAREHVTRVLRTALEELDWSESDEALRLVFVAGNEEADQDPEIDYEEVADLARERDVVVHGIFCGSSRSRAATTWNALAHAAGTQPAVLDLRHGGEPRATPYDTELVDLIASLDGTYVPLGERGAERLELQRELDRKVGELGAATAASRAEIKISSAFAPDWDLVAAVESGRLEVAEVAEGDLPEELRRMTIAEREALLYDLSMRRADIRERIAELSGKRRELLAARPDAPVRPGQPATLRSVVGAAIRNARERRGLDAD
jgi:hypothetical protein